MKSLFITMLVVFSASAFADGKIDCNGTIYAQDDVVSEALFRNNIEPAASLEEAKYIITQEVAYGYNTFTDGLDRKGCGLIVCGGTKTTWSTASLYKKVNTDKKWIVLKNVQKHTSNTSITSRPDYPRADKVIIKSLDSLIESVCE